METGVSFRRRVVGVVLGCTLVLLVLAAPAAASTTFRGTWLCNWKVSGD